MKFERDEHEVVELTKKDRRRGKEAAPSERHRNITVGLLCYVVGQADKNWGEALPNAVAKL